MKKLLSLVIVIGLLLTIVSESFVFAERMEINTEESNEIILASDEYPERASASIKYGPHRGVNEDQKRAYEPFNVEKNSENINDLPENSYNPKKILIKLDESQSFSFFNIFSQNSENKIESVIESLEEFGVNSLEPLITITEDSLEYPNANSGFSLSSINIFSSKEKSTWYSASLKEGTDYNEVLNRVVENENVLSAEPEHLFTTQSLGLPDETTDPDFAMQWYLESLGITDAWTFLDNEGINPGGNRDIVVAVIDTGVDYNHIELKGNMWVNPAETLNGQDSDGNGYIDDIHGVNVITNSGDPLDDHGHGTHVAGIIAAMGNNGEGGVGVAFNVKIMAIKAAQSSGVLSSTDIAKAVHYAVENGADVINMSFGGPGRAIIVEDALQIAYGTSVLVASAGNSGVPNEPISIYPAIPSYPAALPWVIGVMSSDQYPKQNGDYLSGFSNWDPYGMNSIEYEIMAPGNQILSTLPNDKYARWSGTSMAAPVVSGIAAILRSYFSDKETYSSRFIAGQLSATGPIKQGKTPFNLPPRFYREVNAYEALTNTPEPNVTYLEHYIFDTPNILERNNGDGIVDAGEIINLGMVIRNHWGKADDITVTMNALSPAGIPDPYVEFINEAVNFGSIGSFNVGDNGLLYDEEGVIVGVQSPFQIKFSENTPNDHLVKININITAKNGYDASDETIYSSNAPINIIVRKGRVLKGIISQDMTLTKDDYWIIPDATLIEEGVKVTVEPGTQIQFWGSDPKDPYAESQIAYLQVEGEFIVNGTAEEPVEIFPSKLHEDFNVLITSKDEVMIDDHSLGLYSSRNSLFGRISGYAEINYTKIYNPYIAVNKIYSTYFSQIYDWITTKYLYFSEIDYTSTFGPHINSDVIENSIFYKLGSIKGSGKQPLNIIANRKIGCLVDSSYYDMNVQFAENNVLLKNYRLSSNESGEIEYWSSIINNMGPSYSGQDINMGYPILDELTGDTYFYLDYYYSNLPIFDDEYFSDEIASRIASYLGGEIVTIKEEMDNEFVQKHFSENWPGVYIVRVPGNVPLSSIDIETAEIILGEGGTKEQIKLIYHPFNATVKDIFWTSDNSQVASVDENGLVTPISLGQTNITATSKDGGFISTVLVNVIEEIPATGIELDKTQKILNVGEDIYLSAQVFPLNTTNRGVIWSSSDENIATVNNGVVEGKSFGNAIITATTEDGLYADYYTINVYEPVTDILLEYEYFKINLNDTNTTVNASVYPEIATDKSLNYRSSNTNIVKIDEGGLITPITEGTAYIFVKSNNGIEKKILTIITQSDSNQITKLKAGPQHSLALDLSGNLYASGSNNYGQLGNSINEDSKIPVSVLIDSEIKKIDASYSHSLAVTVDNRVYSWGIGIGNSMYPRLVSNLDRIIDVSAGSYFSLALKDDGTVWAWGSNGNGQLGDGTLIDRTTPIQIEGLTNIVKIVSGEHHSMALDSDGKVYLWGISEIGEFGNETDPRSLIPVSVVGLENIVDIETNNWALYALDINGNVYSWGYNSDGVLGYEDQSYKIIMPKKISALPTVSKIAAGGANAGAIDLDGNIWMWGSNSSNALGCEFSDSYSNAPIKITENGEYKELLIGSYYSLALNIEGYVLGWGSNYSGQLANGTTDIVATPELTFYGLIPDMEGPQIINSNPSNLATEVSANTKIEIEFDEDIVKGEDFSYISVISVRDENNSNISLKIKKLINNTLYLETLNSFEYGKAYKIVLPKSGIHDLFGNYLSEVVEINFTVENINSESEITSDSDANIFTIQDSASQIQTDFEIIRVEYSNFTQEDFDEFKTEIFESGILSLVTNNAFLNTWWDPESSHWLRFAAANNRNTYSHILGNYWGTTSDTLIEKAILDYNDDFNKGKIIYNPILSEAPETAYPFVTDVYITTELEERASIVGAENIEINVMFNRDMDMDINPMVSFGPDEPFTDYLVQGSWQSPRHWIGNFNVGPITGDGYQMFRVAGAVAADNPWLVTGNDSERFRFEIITSGTEAMNLQASGEEGKILLSWTQDDFDVLAGFNIYRSSELDGSYFKINETVIPNDSRSFTDLEVVPGLNYFYKFTVVKTDLTESDFSNIAMAAAIDTIPPVISHTPINRADPGMPITVFSDVTDNVSVSTVDLFYKLKGMESFLKKSMILTAGNRYSATIEGSFVQSPGIEYYILASDGISQTRSIGLGQYHQITVDDSPKITSISPSSGPQAGGTEVTIVGSNFKEGASVSFGGVLANNIVVESGSRISVTAPSHIPETVDVKVANLDGNYNTLLRSYTYRSQDVIVQVPQVSANVGNRFEVPIFIENVKGLLAIDLRIEYDENVLEAKSVRKGNITGFFDSPAYNLLSPGVVSISLASGSPVNGTGIMLYVEFLVLESEVTTSAISLTNLLLNDGAIEAQIIDGDFNLSDKYSIGGNINYYSNGELVQGVLLVLENSDRVYNSTTNENGNYTISEIISGDYNLSASKNDMINGISAYDASLILQYSVGLIELSQNQKIAADVNGNGVINAMDASYVIQKAVGLIPGAFPGSGKVWAFAPENKEYEDISYNYTQENFVAILLGDVSGNWQPESTEISLFSIDSFSLEDKLSVWQGAPVSKEDQNYIPLMFNPQESKIYSIEMILNYNSNIISGLKVSKTDLSKDFLFAVNELMPGKLKIVMAGANPIEGAGELLRISLPDSINFYNIDLEISMIEINEIDNLAVFEKGILPESFLVIGKRVVELGYAMDNPEFINELLNEALKVYSLDELDLLMKFMDLAMQDAKTGKILEKENVGKKERELAILFDSNFKEGIIINQIR